MILETIDHLSDRVFRWAESARIFARVSEHHTRVASRRRKPRGRRDFYRSVLRWQEEGSVFRAERWMFERLLSARTSDIGALLLTFGGVGLLGNWFYRQKSPLSFEILLPMICILLAPILLNSSRTISHSIRKSVILRWFLFEFCGIEYTTFFPKRRIRPQRKTFFAVGCLVGLLSVWVSPVFFALAVLGGLLLALLSAVPEPAYCCVLFLLPFLGLAPHPTRTLTILLAICLALCLGKTLSGKRQGEWEPIDGLVLWITGLFLLGSVVTYGSFFEGALRAFLLFASWFPFRVLFCNSVWRRRACLSLTLSSFVCAIGGVVEYFLGRAVLGWVDVSRFGDIGGRVCGFFGNPNLFAIFLLLTTPLTLRWMLGQKSMVGRVFSSVVFLTQSLCMILTWSRGGWLGWMFSVAVFLILCNRRTLSALIALFVCGFGLVFYLPENVLNRFGSIASTTDSSVHYRLNTWRGVCRMLFEHPFGIGSGESAFRTAFPRYAVSGTETVMHAHQIFLEVAVEIGVVGLILFLLVLWHLFARVVRFCRRHSEGEKRTEGVCLAATLTGALMMGLFDSLWYHGGLYWLFWSIAAMLVNVTQEAFYEREIYRV